MVFAFLYSWLRLFFGLVDLRLGARDAEAELLLAALSSFVSRAALTGMLVQPETVLGVASRIGAAKIGGVWTASRDRPTFLRHQLRVVRWQVKRPRLEPADRAILQAHPPARAVSLTESIK